MPKRYSSKHIIKVLENNGFVFVSQRGSHTKYSNQTNTVIVVVGKKEIPVGTFGSILRQSSLKKETFENK